VLHLILHKFTILSHFFCLILHLSNLSLSQSINHSSIVCLFIKIKSILSVNSVYDVLRLFCAFHVIQMNIFVNYILLNMIISYVISLLLTQVNGWEEHYGEKSFLFQCKKRFGRVVGEKIWEVNNLYFTPSFYSFFS
jgi:hypothetical protein